MSLTYVVYVCDLLFAAGVNCRQRETSAVKQPVFGPRWRTTQYWEHLLVGNINQLEMKLNQGAHKQIGLYVDVASDLRSFKMHFSS